MKTIIIKPFELDEMTRSAASQEALRRKKPVNEILRDWVLKKARVINEDAKRRGKQPASGKGMDSSRNDLNQPH